MRYDARHEDVGAPTESDMRYLRSAMILVKDLRYEASDLLLYQLVAARCAVIASAYLVQEI